MTRLKLAALLLALPLVAGCVPAAIGAGAAITADETAENNGGNLF
ncbi:hypothetical protein [Jannaschia sp. Os4]|nr:hypothetical protein [Jannaschia sp. Os4]